jgi:formiminotetrahydrofolate cyclodeaminase
VTLRERTLEAILDALGDRTPTPGGGAVAGVAVALGAATARMVVSWSVGRPALAAHGALLHEAGQRLRELQDLALDLADADAVAYDALSALMKLPADDATRRDEMPAATAAAIDVPARTIAAAVDVLEHVARLVGRSNRKLASDLEVAAIVAEAAARAAAANVRANLALLASGAERARIEAASQRGLARAAELHETIVAEIARGESA